MSVEIGQILTMLLLLWIVLLKERKRIRAEGDISEAAYKLWTIQLDQVPAFFFCLLRIFFRWLAWHQSCKINDINSTISTSMQLDVARQRE
jgi:hypothetical protein